MTILEHCAIGADSVAAAADPRRASQLFAAGEEIREGWFGGATTGRVMLRVLGRRGAVGHDVSLVANAARGRDEALKSVRLRGASAAERHAEQAALLDEARTLLRVGGHANVQQVRGRSNVGSIWERPRTVRR